MKVGVIGFGHLGKALVEGLLYTNISTSDEVSICARTQKTLEIARDKYGVNTYNDINKLIAGSDIVFIVLKGDIFDKISHKIDKTLIKDKLVVSFMAGVPIASIMEKLGQSIHVTRAMPSIAINKGNGVIGYTRVNNELISEIFNRLGYAFEVEESDIEKVTAFSACGLGFAAYILDSFMNAGINLGFDEEVSERIVAKTFVNAINMSNYPKTISEVATKGGATEQGILYFQKENINGIIEEAIKKAYKKMI